MKNAVIVGGTGGLGSAVVETLKHEYKFDERWLSSSRPDVLDEHGYDHIDGPVDLAIYLAGINITKPVDEISASELNQIFSVNILGAFNFVRNLKSKMLGGSKPTFVFTSSIMVDHPYPNRTAYAATKAAVEGLSNALSVELGEYKISSVCLRLGHLTSLMKSTPPNPHLLDGVRACAPQNNLVDSSRIGDVIRNIHECSDMFNGAVVDLDGGYTKNRWPL